MTVKKHRLHCLDRRSQPVTISATSKISASGVTRAEFDT